MLDLAFVERFAEGVSVQSRVFVHNLPWLLEYGVVVFNTCSTGKNTALLSQTHIIGDLARASGDNHGEPTHPLDNTSRRSSPCTPRSPVLLSHIQVPPSPVLAEQGSARAAKKTHTRPSVYLTITGSFGLASKRPDKLYTYILKNHQAS